MMNVVSVGADMLRVFRFQLWFDLFFFFYEMGLICAKSKWKEVERGIFTLNLTIETNTAAWHLLECS